MKRQGRYILQPLLLGKEAGEVSYAPVEGEGAIIVEGKKNSGTDGNET
ncbi:MAG: hypothetical protein N2595_08550 [bacterium]|nr:hypothetical protein [bacterium]